jgi:hypothetical protein
MILGWSLNELGHRFRATREEKKAYAKAIAELLEIRHNVVGVSNAFEQLRIKLEITEQDWSIAKEIFKDFLPKSDGIKQRYNVAVDLISEINPILGYKLRSKDLWVDIDSELETLLKLDPNLLQYKSDFLGMFNERVKTSVEKSLFELAKYHGWKTRFSMKKFLKKPIYQTEEFDDMTDELFNKILQEPAASKVAATESGKS